MICTPLVKLASASFVIGVLLSSAATELPVQSKSATATATAPATPPATAPATQPKKENTATTPVARSDAGWKDRNQKMNDLAQKGDIDLLFLGDSITQGWENEGKDVWVKHYGTRKAANFGIGGDRTQHVLWRIQNGNLNGLDKHPPKCVVLMIGTNNSNGADNTAPEIAEGIASIVRTLREKLPQTKILLLAIFPRGEVPNTQRNKNTQASALASKIADGNMVHYLDINSEFVDEKGNISKDIMPDYLHLSAEGYERWAKAIEPKVKKLLGE